MTTSYQTIDPATGTLIESYNLLSQSGLQQKLRQSNDAFLEWKAWPLSKRSGIFHQMAENLTHHAQMYAKTINLEMGKPILEGEAEIAKCAWACRYFADNAAEFLAPQQRSSDHVKSYVRYDPLGIILAVMPWNFPFWQVFRVSVPTMLAGNVMLLKHASNTPRCALLIEEIFKTAGCPDGSFLSLFVRHEDIDRIIADPRVRGVTLTGSSNAGKNVAKSAGSHLKPCVMELGGSDPFIVFDDADLATAIETGAKARCQNSGQSCVSAKRFLIHRSIFEAYVQGLVKSMQAYPIGPLATGAQREIVSGQVTDAITKGAQVLAGGQLPATAGFFYPQTVLTFINPSMRVWHEEVFGPVASAIPFDHDDEVLALANETSFGLGAAVFTKDATRIKRFARELACGNVFFNEMVRSDPRLPFGGIKDSGFGRELGPEGMHSFVNIKAVVI